MSRVLVLGAYGLIGAGVAQALARAGHHVTGFGRSAVSAAAVAGVATWRLGDLRDMTAPERWQTVLAGVDIVVNCAGALQDGPEDDLTLVHDTAIDALARACAAAGVGVVQVSAAGASADASTLFMRSKFAGDQAVIRSGAPHWILRPGLVIAPTAYGGTALLRMLAAVPLVQPVALGDTRIQTIGLGDLADAVVQCVAGYIPSGTVADLVADEVLTLRELLRDIRGWLGFAPARAEVNLPGWLLSSVATCADFLGRLGWRSPLRRTALDVLKQGVTAESGQWRAAGGAALAPLRDTLHSCPARAEDRLAARMSLLMPVVVATLVVFWLTSGVIGLVSLGGASRVLTETGWPFALAALSVGVWSLVDIALALLLAWRKTARLAVPGMIATALFYLVAATLFTPALWLDPLGPLVKILPAAVLALVALPMLAKR
ncbi:MAG: oxidoreductase [Rhodobacterales bacterium]|nr:MAG: oxidoreductase [Rhodobacterales bacterium]